jgi:hypothetical protein
MKSWAGPIIDQGAFRQALETVNRRACLADALCVSSAYGKMFNATRLFAFLALLGTATTAQAEMVMFSQRNFQGTSYALTAASSSLSFSPRSARVLPDEPWELCPRPFFGGTCVIVSKAEPKLNLPRGFSGMVRSARPAAGRGQATEKDAEPQVQPKP